MLQLPPELKEAIVIQTAAGGFPTGISCLARTCRDFRTLIYSPVDQRLWREIFLTTFDDPRELYFVDSSEFDWGHEFRRRVSAESFFKSHSVHTAVILSLLPVSSSFYHHKTTGVGMRMISGKHEARCLEELRTLLSVIKTTAPCDLKYGSSFTTNDRLGTQMPHRAQPLVHTLNYISVNTPEFAVRTDRTSAEPSRNISWLQGTLKQGLPLALVHKFAGYERDSDWDKSPEAQALGELVCCTGLIPARELPEVFARDSHRVSASSSDEDINTPVRKSSLDMTADGQATRARYRAREIVYNLSYLTRRRHWGPYLPVFLPPDETSMSQYAQASNVDSVSDVAVDNSETDSEVDPDFIPSEDDILTPPETDNAAETEGMIQRRRRMRALPTPKQLVPDWTWLAAARIIVEANLREIKTTGVDEFITWNIWRERAWVLPEHDRKRKTGFSGQSEEGVGQESEPAKQDSEDEVPGWDWAGVEGFWRRCVSWLGYSHLIHHNMYGRFDNPDLHECMLIVPLRLRVVGYEPSSVPQYPDRPTLLVVGEMGGEEWEGIPETVEDDVRRVHGSVSTLSDGSVRWSLFSADAEDPTVDQWVSEGIQIGCVGSEGGVLGMWTGAQHESDDPLGPFWQWRVA